MVLISHPRPEELAAFVQGKLSAADFIAVEQHLLRCDVCVRSLQDQPEDSLHQLARQARTFADTAAPHGASSTPPAAEGATVFLRPPAAGEPNASPPCPWQAPSQDEVPGLLARHGRYRVLRLLGQGGMGAVYVAEHRVMRRLVALKVIKPVYTADPAAVERFRREVRAAAQLQHPNIVTAHDADRAGDRHFLVMEYVEGVSLAHLLRERGPLPVAVACAYVRQAALGLQHAHERGLVHRDIKPDNLMRTADETVKVLDFGLAALTAERGPDGLTSANVVMGTPDYMAPEQAEDARAADIRADVYSLGCTLYELLTGQVPYPAPTGLRKVLAHRDKPLPSVRDLRPEVPPELAEVLARMLFKRPADRYQTPGEVAEALAPFATTTPGAGELGRRPRRWLLTVAALSLLAALLGAVAVYRIQTERGEIVLRTDDPHLEVVIRRSGRLVRIRDRKTGQVWALDTDNYRIGMADRPGGLTIALPDREPLTLVRGDKPILTVTRGPAAAKAVPPKGEAVANGRRPAHGEFTGALYLYLDTRYRNLSPPDCLDRAVAAMGRKEKFLLAEKRNGAAFGYTETTAAVVYAVFARNQTDIYVVAMGSDDKEVQRIRSALVSHVCDGPDPGEVPARIVTKTANRKTHAPALRVGGGSRPLDALHFIDAAVAALQRQGLRITITEDWSTVFGFGHDHALVVSYEPEGDTTGYVSLVVGAYEPRVAERLRDAIQADVFAGRVPPGLIYRMWAAPTPGEHSSFSAISPDNRFFLVGADSDSARPLRLANITTGKEMHQLPGHSLGLFTPDSKQVVSFGPAAGKLDRQLVLWDVATGEEVRHFEGHTAAVEAADVSADGKHVLSTSADRTVRLWELGTGKQVRRFDDPGNGRGGVAFAPDGKRLLSWRGKALRLRDADTGKALHILDAKKGEIEGACFLPGGKEIAWFCRADHTLRVWDLVSGGEVRRFELGADLVRLRPLAFSPGSGRFLTAHRDRTQRLRDLGSGKEIAHFELRGAEGEGEGGSLSADGRWALFSTARQTTHLLRLPQQP
jgi:hypothetical protein